MTLDNVPTPALIIDLPTVERNLARMADYCREHQLNLRPHTKTHKSLRMARRQLHYGAVGLTVAKVGEAEVMAEACDDLLIAYPALDPARTQRIAALAGRCTVRVAVDSQVAADAIHDAARAAGTTVGLLVDFATGMNRTGLQYPEEALSLAQHIDGLPHARLDGLFCYPGHVKGDAESMGAKLRKVDGRVKRVLRLWAQHDLHAGIVTGGATPAAWHAHEVTSYTEVRPGTYIYNDRNTLEGGYCHAEDTAAYVLATVVSTAVPDQCVIDAGGKSLTYDRPAYAPATQEFGRLRDDPLAVIHGISEEHGQVSLAHRQDRPKLGDRVEVLMNHVCPCVNLVDQAWVRPGPGPELEPLRIDARGRLS